MAKFRKWLKDNKIFFEVFSMFFLGVMSIVLTWTSIRISQRQVDIEEHKLIPRIEIDYRFEADISKKSSNSEVINIYNHGGDILDLEIDLFCFLNLLFESKTNEEIIPFKGYFNQGNIVKNSSTNLIYEIGSNYTQRDLIQRGLSLIEVLPAYPDFNFVMRIKYKDVFKKQHVKYYSFYTLRDSGKNGNFKEIIADETVIGLIELYNERTSISDPNRDVIPKFENLTQENVKNQYYYKGFDD